MVKHVYIILVSWNNLRPITTAAKWAVGGGWDVVLLQPAPGHSVGGSWNERVGATPPLNMEMGSLLCVAPLGYITYTDPSHEPCSPTFVSVL